MHLPFSNGFLPLTLLALDKSEPCGYFPFATAASPAPATTAASQLFSLSASSLSARKDGPPCPIIHSLLYCITPATDSLWTERSYHSSGMSAVFFSVRASFPFIYLAAFFFTRNDCIFEDCPYRDASRNVSQQMVFFKTATGLGPKKISSLSVFSSSN